MTRTNKFGLNAGGAAHEASQNSLGDQTKQSSVIGTKPHHAATVNPSSHKTQIGKLMEYFAANPRRWASMPFLYRISGSMNIHSRVADIRRIYGWQIENRTFPVNREGQIVRVSYYRYVPHEQRHVGHGDESYS